MPRYPISALLAPALFVLLSASCGAWLGDETERFVEGEAAFSNASPPEGFAFASTYASGTRYFVREGGAGVSTDRSAPGDPTKTIENATDGSTIVFLAGKYRSPG